jgi:transcriptional regulator with XRE-family HTH domain
MFTDRFVQTIQTKQLTAYKVAKETGISQGLMNEYKNGIKLPTLQNLLKIANYLECSVDYLLGRTNYPNLVRADEKGNLIVIEAMAPRAPEEKN